MVLGSSSVQRRSLPPGTQLLHQGQRQVDVTRHRQREKCDVFAHGPSDPVVVCIFSENRSSVERNTERCEGWPPCSRAREPSGTRNWCPRRRAAVRHRPVQLHQFGVPPARQTRAVYTALLTAHVDRQIPYQGELHGHEDPVLADVPG